MTFLLSPSRLDRALRRGAWFIVIGFPVLVAVVAMQQGPTVTPMMATALGAGCGSLGEWRRDRGLWMLAVVFLLMFFPIYLAFVGMELFGSKSELSILQIIDFSIATMVVGQLCRVLVSVAVHNWRYSHGPSRAADA
ncbi:MAG TPA: hypothetical protein VGR35_15490 [Tepidisphaeraceae bacterium]|nr:hypothetical protein [Tepidisphaeraceae bacterium]